ncbi:MAG TPA: hypothetical protein IGS17_17390 [Oscillatoriales cyanobacterium M59_W2019_021]|nr:MAG: hypothetical protein D6728_16415 [Cyanobacteria bacterium J055]HIK31046.1 hypothetical protein [Oscillatoriales cyanobacterium M4454_W2019_049]HIK52680.1 hypothetical protein [Oscillatoriales cyanobacterium M59_W2019_021]
MTQRLKRWESPRKPGRNSKGKGGSARARQLRKQQQQLRKKLHESQVRNKKREDANSGTSLSFLFAVSRSIAIGKAIALSYQPKLCYVYSTTRLN